jgi:hypothetical protein
MWNVRRYRAGPGAGRGATREFYCHLETTTFTEVNDDDGVVAELDADDIMLDERVR